MAQTPITTHITNSGKNGRAPGVHHLSISHHGAGDWEGRRAALHGRWRLQPPQCRRLHRSWEVCWLQSGPGSSPAQLSSQARLRGSDRRTSDYTLLWQSVDLQPRALWNQQIRDLQVPDGVSSHPLGLHCGYPVCYPQLSAHLDPNAFCEDLPHGPAFRADDMEECDRCCHWPIVYKCRAHLLLCQHATEPWLNTQTPGPNIWILYNSVDVTQKHYCSVHFPFVIIILKMGPRFINVHCQIFSNNDFPH